MTEPTATLPESWQEVPFGPYCQYAAAPDLTGRLTAFAGLIGLQPEQLVGNTRVYFLAKADMPWLDTLPVADTPATIVHQGITYAHCGNLETLNVGQLEGLMALLQEHEAAPTLAGPGILALLYCPQGQEQTLATVQAATAAFQTLPMSVAWPALLGFMRALGPSALSFQQYSAAQSTVSNLLNTVEASLASSTASQPWYSKLRSAGVRRLLQSARSRLGPSCR